MTLDKDGQRVEKGDKVYLHNLQRCGCAASSHRLQAPAEILLSELLHQRLQGMHSSIHTCTTAGVG